MNSPIYNHDVWLHTHEQLWPLGSAMNANIKYGVMCDAKGLFSDSDSLH